MFTEINKLKQDEAIKIIYHLIMILNKGKNDSSNDIEIEEVTSDLSENENIILNNILVEIDFDNIDSDELLNNYIVEAYELLEKITTNEKNLNLERGRNRLLTLSVNNNI